MITLGGYLSASSYKIEFTHDGMSQCCCMGKWYCLNFRILKERLSVAGNIAFLHISTYLHG